MNKMNTIKKLAVAVVFAMVGLCGTGWAAPAAESDFEFESATGTITLYKGEGGDVEIPATIGGVDVTAIGASAFSENTTLTSVTIPAGVTNVGASAFSICVNLTAVTFAAGSQLKNVGVMAFYNCGKLVSVTFPSGCPLANIDDAAFNLCGLTSVAIPAGVTNIGQSAFYECSSLVSATFEPDSKLEFIGSTAFYKSGLTSVTIPAGVKRIEGHAFAECNKLEEVTVLATEPPTAGQLLFADEQYHPIATLKTIKVPVGALDKYKGADVWKNYANLFTDGSTAAEVDFDFDEATGTITLYKGAGGDVVIPTTIGGVDVKVIGTEAFREKTTLTSVTIPANVTNINESAFLICFNLTNVTFAAGSQLKTIGGSAFSGCEKLANVTFPADCSLENIAFGAFGFTALREITIPASVTNVGERAFTECCSITNVTFAEGSQLKSIEYNAFDGCEKLASVVFPAECHLESIGYEVFHNSGLTSITIPASVTNIGEGAFCDCKKLASVTFEEGSKLEIITARAFDGSGLTGITIPASVTNIGDKAFYSCKNLASVKLAPGSKLESIGKQAFASSHLKEITIPATVTNVGYSAFDGCGKLESVSFAPGSQLREIGENMFTGCTALKEITIPANMTAVGSGAFNGCLSLANVSFAAGSQLKKVGDGAFLGCPLTGITLPAGLTDIGKTAFGMCGELTEITIPASVTNIGMAAFAMCSKLEEVTVLATEPPKAGEKLFSKDGTDATIQSLKAIKVPAESVDKYKNPATGNGWDAYADLITAGTAPSPAEPIAYQDWNGTELTNATCTAYTVVTDTMTELNSGWYVVQDTVVIDRSGETDQTLCKPGLKVNGSAHLILCDEASLVVTGAYNCAGIEVAAIDSVTNSLTIYGQANQSGRVEAAGGYEGACIGGNARQSCGIVTINGGEVTACNSGTDWSHGNGAGIGGGGYGGNGGIVTVNGGTVYAWGASDEDTGAAGIGGGGYAFDDGPGQGWGGVVTVNGGNVTAIGNNGAAGIGGGVGLDFGHAVPGDGGIVTINGGTVMAIAQNGWWRAAGIGGSGYGKGGQVTINAGDVTAIGDENADGIGKGAGAAADAYGTFALGPFTEATILAGMDPTGDGAQEVKAEDFADLDEVTGWHAQRYVHVTATKPAVTPQVKIVSAKSARTEGAWSGAAQVVYELNGLAAAKTYALAVELAAAGQFGATTNDLPTVVDGVYTQALDRAVFFGTESQVEDPAAELQLKLIERE